MKIKLSRTPVENHTCWNLLGICYWCRFFIRGVFVSMKQYANSIQPNCKNRTYPTPSCSWCWKFASPPPLECLWRGMVWTRISLHVIVVILSSLVPKPHVEWGTQRHFWGARGLWVGVFEWSSAGLCVGTCDGSFQWLLCGGQIVWSEWPGLSCLPVQIATVLDCHAATLQRKADREVFFMNTQSIVQLVQKWVSGPPWDVVVTLTHPCVAQGAAILRAGSNQETVPGVWNPSSSPGTALPNRRTKQRPLLPSLSLLVCKMGIKNTSHAESFCTTGRLTFFFFYFR